MTEQFGYKIFFYLLCVVCFILLNVIIIIKKRNNKEIAYLHDEIEAIKRVKYSYENSIKKLHDTIIDEGFRFARMHEELSNAQALIEKFSVYAAAGNQKFMIRYPRYSKFATKRRFAKWETINSEQYLKFINSQDRKTPHQEMILIEFE
jgi:hypothetical protein